MRALLLAAGFGTRLRPLTNYVPKCMVPVGGRPLLDYWLEALVSSGFKEILINTHYLAPLVVEYVNRSTWSPYVRFVHESHLLGTGGTIVANQAFIAGESVLVAHADNLTLFNVPAFCDAHRRRPSSTEMTMMLFETDDPRSCGIVECDERGVVSAFHEKVQNPPSNLANAAVYIFEPSVIRLMAETGGDGLDISTQVIPLLTGRINTYLNQTYHRDIGTVASWKQANRDFQATSFSPQNERVWQDMCLADDAVLHHVLLQLLEEDPSRGNATTSA
ncbi:Nucleoside-diphosphate-sugar pyrophosphorylase family protein [Herbaspirillum sp. CF444]|uniref:nucleotidyltransferase family protein n=1 Tax=Herbaspirillum sp. CF444 TaxID=1144319 RepID=UPI000272343F|nr:nucleotidyltransferase family protein [Herbaspirillum sp. CF444]EJL81433.1 Nucleoside-diphosphate-sugar pyrophosphorylase family protein [Herbaspirillum sp. CF444]